MSASALISSRILAGADERALAWESLHKLRYALKDPGWYTEPEMHLVLFRMRRRDVGLQATSQDLKSQPSNLRRCEIREPEGYRSG